MKALEVTSQNFEAEVLGAKGPVLVDFWGPGCQPCARMAPIVEAVADQLGGEVKVVKVDTSVAPELAMQFGIRSIPTFLVLDQGKVVRQRVGSMSRDDLVDWITDRD